MWTILKVFIEFIKYYFCFIFCFSGHEAHELLALWPGIVPAPALKHEVLTTGSPGKPLNPT